MIDTGEPSPASLRSGTPGASRMRHRQAHARVRREGAVRERGLQRIQLKAPLTHCGEGDQARRAWWVRVCGGPGNGLVSCTVPRNPCAISVAMFAYPMRARAAALSDLDAIRRGAGFAPN